MTGFLMFNVLFGSLALGAAVYYGIKGRAALSSFHAACFVIQVASFTVTIVKG